MRTLYELFKILSEQVDTDEGIDFLNCGRGLCELIYSRRCTILFTKAETVLMHQILKLNRPSEANFPEFHQHPLYNQRWSGKLYWWNEDFIFRQQVVEQRVKFIKALADKFAKEYFNGNCEICDTPIHLQFCCSGRECGCLGMPVDPPVCSEGCYNKYMNKLKDIAVNHEEVKSKVDQAKRTSTNKDQKHNTKDSQNTKGEA